MSEAKNESRRKAATSNDLLGAENDGVIAAQNKVSFRDCPYLFSKFPEMSPQKWNEKMKPIMNAWFRGWKRQLDSQGLQYDFKPRRVRI